MRIGIDISQIAHKGTGVANYTTKLVEYLLQIDKDNEYILFYSSLRNRLRIADCGLRIAKNTEIKSFRLPLTILDILWNRLHIAPIEWFIGDVDVFLSSDWVQPPAKKAKKVTVIHDLIPLKYPEESHPKTEFSWRNLLIKPNIVNVQKRRLNWVKKEADCIICDSSVTKRDCIELLGINDGKLVVIYPAGG